MKIREIISEASYPGNIGAMEVMRFFKLAQPDEKVLLKKLIDQKDYKQAWALIQKITGIKLQGKEFREDTVNEGLKTTLIGLGVSGAIAVGALGAMNIKQALTSPDIPKETKIKIIQQADLEKKDIPKLIADLKKQSPKEDDYHGFGEPIQLIQVVEKGDTVYSIAREYGVTPEDIRRVNKLDKKFTIKPGQELGIPVKSSQKEFTYKKSDKPAGTEKTLYNDADEKRLMQGLLANGIKGVELAAFMAQAAHETRNFEAMVEEGSPRYFLRYDKTGKKKAHRLSAKRLGNTEPGDGARYKGRGYLQLTGRDNYTRVGKRIGVDLANNPELLENPDVNLKASIAYWKMRTSSKVKNFNNIRAVTYTINPGLDKLEWRKEQFKNYKQLLALK